MADEGLIVKQIRELLRKRPDMPRTEMAEAIGISRKTLYKHLGRIDAGTQAENPGSASPKDQKKGIGGKPHKKEMHPHDGRRQNKGKPPPGPHSTGFKPGNDAATKTGEHRNPLLHAVSAERVALVRLTDESPADLLRRSIEVHQLATADMTEEIEAIKASAKKWWWVGTTYTRQEGDGELLGTGRIAQRKREPREEALKAMIEARARVQARLDSAVEKLHKMLQDTEGGRKKGLADVLAAIKADDGDEDDD